jgi:hypothetical protein
VIAFDSYSFSVTAFSPASFAFGGITRPSSSPYTSSGGGGYAPWYLRVGNESSVEVYDMLRHDDEEVVLVLSQLIRII